MKTVRLDRAPISKIMVDSQTGFLHIPNVPIARVGVFPYRKGNDSVEMEAKLPTELLADTAVESANNKVVTNDHPPVLVDKDNAGQYTKGFTSGNAHVDGDTVRVDMTIMDKDLINEIQNKGKEELSIGFETEVSPEKGEYKGVKYDSVQRNIQINHVAVVDRGRAGHSIRLTGDAAEMIDGTKKGENMAFKKVMFDGAEITVDENDVPAVENAQKKSDDKQAKIDELKSKIAKLQAQLKELQGNSDDSKQEAADSKKEADQAKAKADALEAELADYKKKYEGDAFDKAVANRLSLIEEVKPYLGDSYDFAGKTSQELKKAAIKSVNDSVDLEDKNSDYVDAYFDSLKANHTSTIVGYSGVTTTKTDSADSFNSKAEALLYKRYHLAENRGGK